MNPKLNLAFLSLLCFCFFGLSLGAVASDKPVVIVIGEDSGARSVSRFNLVYVRIQDAIIAEFREEGFVTFDETEATEGNFRDQGLERTDSELVQVSQSVTDARIDVALVLAVFLDDESSRYSKTVRVRVVGRAIDVKTGVKLGVYQAEIPGVLRVATDCARDCIILATHRQGYNLALRAKVVMAANIIALVSDGR